MCTMKKLDSGKYVADIKYDYILNIVKQAAKCKNITRIVLFGSSIEERCTEESDIDIAVFGEESKAKYLKSKEFKDFHRNLFTFDKDFAQDYDIIYFADNKEYAGLIMEDISKGVEIYRRVA